MSAQGGEPPMVIVPAPEGTRYRAVHRLATTDSTNRYLVDLAKGGADEVVVAVADHQTSGRGRLGRRWEAPPGANLLMSVLLRPSFGWEALHLCGAAVALAAAAACRGAGVAEGPGLKWPNDVVVGDRKLAGVLVDIVAPPGGPAAPDDGPAVVVGLGLNVQWPAPDGVDAAHPVPPELQGSATSLWVETGERLSPQDVMAAVLTDLDVRLDDLSTEAGRGRQAAQFRASCASLGRDVKVTLAEEELTGRAVDITAQGHLVIDTGDGLRSISAGDVVHLRARR